MPGMSFDQLMRIPQIVAVYEQLHTPASFFQRQFNLSPTGSPLVVSNNRTFGYDLYAATRTIAPISAPMAPPQGIGLKPMGTAMATTFRIHPKITIYYEKVFQTRQLGSFGLNTKVDMSGEKYIAMQIKHMKTQVSNAVEWMVAKMFQGGFGIKPDGGEGFRLCELDDAQAIHKNIYNLPASNKGDLNGIIAAGEEWNNVNAPIVDHLNEISILAARVSGYQPTEVIINGNTAKHLFNNNQLKAVGGSSFTVFESLTNRPVEGGTPPTSGPYKVVFRAIPQYTFHVYNEGLVLADVVADYANQTSVSNWKPLMPDGYALIVPTATDWVSFATSSEPIAENATSDVRMSSGLSIWRTQEYDPPRFDVKTLTNYVPLMPQPQVPFFANVWRTGL